MIEPRFYTAGDSAEALAQMETSATAVRRRRLPAVRRVYYDTFDGRLHRAGRRLLSRRRSGAHELEWRDAAGKVLGTVRTASLPTRAGALPEADWAAELAGILGVRALLPIAHHRRAGMNLEILDLRRKIVARLAVIEGDVQRPAGGGAYRPLPPLLRVTALRGYTDEADAVARELVRAHAQPLAGDELEHIAQALDLELGVDPSKFAPRFDPEQPAGDAVRAALGRLHDIVRLNQPGTVRGLDPEFLHQLRVAVRRSRSILGQLSDLFDERPRRALADELRWLGRQTGPARDLDVYRLKIDGYSAGLPDSVRRDLTPLSRLLEKKHRQSQRRLARVLQSARYERLLKRWAAFVDDDGNSTEAANRPIAGTAAGKVRKARRRLLKRGRAIEETTPDEALHRLRIDGKKLRYLLELFRSLWSPKDATRAIKQLKRLQDVLGEFNDLAVHRAALAEYASELEDPAALIATGRLVEQLAERARQVRGRFAERFAALDSPPTEKLFRRLGGSGGESA